MSTRIALAGLCWIVVWSPFTWLALAQASRAAQLAAGTSAAIELTCQASGESHGSATGFFINTAGDFVTARHVVESFERLGATKSCAIVAIASQQGWKRDARPLRVTDCVKSATQDLAACKVDPNPFDSLGFMASPGYMVAARPKHGAPVTAVGFPEDAMFKQPVTIDVTVALYDSMQFECRPSGGTWVVFSGPSVWLKSAPLAAAGTQGMSGGPVFLAGAQTNENDVVGMFVCFGADHVIAVPADAIMKFLHEHNIPTERRSSVFISLP